MYFSCSSSPSNWARLFPFPTLRTSICCGQGSEGFRCTCFMTVTGLCISPSRHQRPRLRGGKTVWVRERFSVPCLNPNPNMIFIPLFWPVPSLLEPVVRSSGIHSTSLLTLHNFFPETGLTYNVFHSMSLPNRAITEVSDRTYYTVFPRHGLDAICYVVMGNPKQLYY